MFHCLGGVHHIVFCSVGLIDVLVENDETRIEYLWRLYISSTAV